MTDQRVPRRSFLSAAAATMAGAALAVSGAERTALAAYPRSRARASGDPSPSSTVKLGVASYSFRNVPLDRTLEMIKALRTTYVNFKSVHVPYEKSPQELASLRTRIEAAGFTIVGGGTITFSSDTDEDVRRYFEYAKAAGMPLIVATGAPAVMPRVERFAKQYDIKVAIHNHGPEDVNFPSPYDVLKLVRTMDRRMGLCIDIGHTVRTGTDVVKAVSDAGSRLLDMHAKDLRDLTVTESQCIVGEGAMPMADIFRALDAIHYAGYVNLEYEIDADDPLPGMKQSFAYMRGVLAGLAPAGSHTTSSDQSSSPASNQLTTSERAAGWRLLFDGRTLAGWRGLGYTGVPAAHWTVENGAIKKIASGAVAVQADGQPAAGGDLMTDATYRDFELAWDWKVTPGANSGIKYNVSEELSVAMPPSHAAKGFEYQMLDDDRHADGKLPTHRAGALYDLIAPNAKKRLSPVGQWNHSVIVFNGNHGEHSLNGQKIVAYEVESREMRVALGASKYASIPWFATRRAGHIVLQDHGDEVYFRNLKIRERRATR